MNQPRSCSGTVFTLTIFAAIIASGQPAGTNISAAVYRDKVEPHWFAGTDGATNQFWYRVETARDRREFILVNAAEGKREPAFDHARVAEALAKLTGQPAEAGRLPVRSIELRF